MGCKGWEEVGKCGTGGGRKKEGGTKGGGEK